MFDSSENRKPWVRRICKAESELWIFFLFEIAWGKCCRLPLEMLAYATWKCQRYTEPEQIGRNGALFKSIGRRENKYLLLYPWNVCNTIQKSKMLHVCKPWHGAFSSHANWTENLRWTIHLAGNKEERQGKLPSALLGFPEHSNQQAMGTFT